MTLKLEYLLASSSLPFIFPAVKVHREYFGDGSMRQIAPISPAYSLISSDHAKLKHCFATVRPRVVFAQSSAMFARAFETLRRWTRR